MIKLSRAQVNSWRLSKNHLAERALKRDMPRVVSDACGLQAQVLSGAALSLSARVDNITMEDVEDALWKHWTLVKTWAMRGTLHLLSSYTLSTYVAALKTRHDLHGEKISYLIGPGPEDKKYEITKAEQEQITKAIDNALDQHTLTRRNWPMRSSSGRNCAPSSSPIFSPALEASYNKQPIREASSSVPAKAQK